MQPFASCVQQVTELNPLATGRPSKEGTPDEIRS
jgi:hypothetical protein